MKTKLIKSPFFTIQKKKHLLIDTISGKKFKVTKEIVDFASSYVYKKTYSQQNKLIIDELYKIQFLIYSEDINKITYQLKLQNDPIFGFDYYKKDDKVKNIVFVGIPFGNGNYTSNETRKFPDFFRKMCTTQNLLFRNNFDSMNPNFISSFSQYCQNNLKINLNNNLVKDAGNIYVHQYESRKDIYNKIGFISNKFFKNKDIPFFIGGDHSITYPIIKSACQNYKEISILHFDAHSDTYNSISSEILESNQLHHHGNFVNKVLKLDNVIKYYQFGIRGLINSSGIEDKKIVSYWTHDLIKNIESIKLPNDKNYYITFDIDILDPSFAPGTATPVPNGLNIADIHNLFNHLLKDKKIIGIDFVEVNPNKDINNITMNLAIELIFRLFSYIKL
jgi:agmatinase